MRVLFLNPPPGLGRHHDARRTDASRDDSEAGPLHAPVTPQSYSHNIDVSLFLTAVNPSRLARTPLLRLLAFDISPYINIPSA